MNRRGFLGNVLALGVAPAIVRADSLMRIVPRDMVVASGQEWIMRSSFVSRATLEEWYAPAMWIRATLDKDGTCNGYKSFDGKDWVQCSEVKLERISVFTATTPMERDVRLHISHDCLGR